MIKPLEKIICFFVAVIVVGGCAGYHPMPLTQEAVAEKMVPPELESIRVQAESIKHPILKPIPFDYRNGLSPDEAAILAVIANPMLRSVRNKKKIAAAQLIQAGILPNPQFSYHYGILVGGDTLGKVNPFDVGLGWDIASLISRNDRIDVAKDHAAEVDLEVAWQEWQVAESARLHVYRLIVARRGLAAAKQAENAFYQSWEGTRRSVALGVKTILDLSTAEAGLQDARSVVLEAQSKMEQETLALNRSLGLPPGKVVVLEEGIHLPLMQKLPSIKTLTSDIESRRLDLIALKQGYQSQEARVRAAIRSQFPRINIGLIGGKETDGVQTVGMGINIIDLPFFDRGQGRISKERATRKQLFDEYIARIFEAHANIARILTGIHGVRKQMAGIDASLTATKKLVEISHKAVDEGQIDILSYYQAQGAFNNKQIKKIELEQKMIDLEIALEIASGDCSFINGSGQQVLHERASGSEVSK